MNVKQLQHEIETRREALAEMFDAHKTDDGYQMTPEQVQRVRELNDELTELAKRLEEAKFLDETYKRTQEALRRERHAAIDLPLEPEGERQTAVKSLGQLLAESEAYKAWARGRELRAEFPDFDMKTTMTTSAGFAPESTRTGRVVEYAVRRPVVADIIPQTTTDQAAVVYMEETTFTNAAAPTDEAAAAPESALAYTERTETVRKISTFLPVTDEQLEDVAQVRALIDNRLVRMLALAEEAQLLTGDGVAPNLTGFLNKTGVQSQAKGTDPVPDAIYKAMTLVRATGFAEPTAIVIHPNDWQDIRLLRTIDGIYIWGNPSEAGPERVWGLPAVITTAITENTALLGDFQMYAEIFRRKGVEIKVSDSHSDFFIKGIQAIRADERLALVIYRAAAFCKVTGI